MSAPGSPLTEKPRREAGQPVRWYRPRLEKGALAKLNQRSDLLGSAQTLGFLGLLAATGTLFVALAMRLSWWAVPALFLHGGCCAFLVNGFHELVHDSVFKTRRLNTLFLYVFSFLGWYNHVGFWASHTEHHKFTLHPPDDLEVVLPQQVDFRHLARWGIVDLKGIYWTIVGTWRTARGELSGDWSTYLFTQVKPEMRKALHGWARILLVGHALVAVAALATGYWPVLIAVSFGRFFGAGFQFLVNSTQHIGLVDQYPDFRVCCRTFTANPLLRFLYWHMNYHTEHHMFAGVPCYNLGKLHRMIRHEMPPAPHGLFQTWMEIRQILQRQAKDPNYQHMPPIPPAGKATNRETGVDLL
jgi:fatty acid desaturase